MDHELLRSITAVVVFLGVFCVAPIVIAMLAHQRKMAQMFMDREANQSNLAARVASIEAELGRYRAALAERTISDSTSK